MLLAAGCLQAGTTTPQGAPESAQDAAARIGTPIEQLHDHTDAALHTGKSGLRLVNWSPLIPDELGREGFAGMRIVNDVAYIATDGEHAGFVMVDVRDPKAPVVLGQYVTAGGASQEAVPSWDGNWVFLNLQRTPAAAALAADPLRGTGTGIQIVDVRDKANPRFEAFVPVELQGSHVMFYVELGGKPFLVYNGQPTRQQLPADLGAYTPPPGNSVKLAEFVDVAGKKTLKTVGEFRLPDSLTARVSQGCFPHDQWVEQHPLTQRMVMYVAFWDCGAVTVDVTDPAKPLLLDVDNVMEPSTRARIHFFRPDPTLRDGKVVAWSGPEIDLSPGEPGYLRSYDVTDPSDIKQVGWWRLPGEVENDKPFVFSPHNFDYRGGLMALAHYHAGVWVLNVSDPAAPHAVAYYLPHGMEDAPFQGEVWRKTPNFPEAYFPNAYEVKWYTSPVDGETYLLATERGSGLYVLQMESTATG